MPTSSASATEVEENKQQIAVESEVPAIAAQIGGFHLSGDGNRSATRIEEKERADAASDRAADGSSFKSAAFNNVAIPSVAEAKEQKDSDAAQGYEGSSMQDEHVAVSAENAPSSCKSKRP